MAKSDRRARSLRLKITGMSVLFALALCVTFGLACFFVFRGYARTSILHAAEFNLQLAAQLAAEDLSEMNALAGRLALRDTLTKYLAHPAPSSTAALRLLSEMSELASESSSYQYIQRFIVADPDGHFVQGSTPTYSSPVTSYNLHALPGLEEGALSVWEEVFHDPLFPASAPDSLLTAHPIYRPRTTERACVVYLTASAQLFSDRLAGYDTQPADSVYLTTRKGQWRIGEGRFTPSGLDIVSRKASGVAPRYDANTIEEVRTSSGERYALVTCPVGSFGLSLTHAIPVENLFAPDTVLWVALLCIVLPVTAMGALLFLYLNRVIVRPVEQLQRSMERIAGGDFSTDPSIEWQNELGDVGRGVNRLSRDVSELLARRMADEQERQTLEYKMLQNQVNPHFIYNTLNSIKWMATIQGASGIAEMTTAFARLLKSVAKGNRPLHTMREEFALLNDYCTIQQYRYGGAITVEIAEITDEELCECMIPSFTLQPLAENAIFHGIEPKGGAGSIWLRISREADGTVLITMEDDGVGMTREAIDRVWADDGHSGEQYSQIGLRNVHRRIQYAFGAQYGLSIESEPGEYTRVAVRIPHRPTREEPLT